MTRRARLEDDGAFRSVLAYEGLESYHKLQSHVGFAQNKTRQEHEQRGSEKSMAERRREERRGKTWEVRDESCSGRWGEVRSGIVGIDGLILWYCNNRNSKGASQLAPVGYSDCI